MALYGPHFPPQRRLGRGARGIGKPMASASPPSGGKAAAFPEVQEEEEAKRRQIEHWRSELSNLSAERSRLQQWRASQVARPPPQPCRSRVTLH